VNENNLDETLTATSAPSAAKGDANDQPSVPMPATGPLPLLEVPIEYYVVEGEHGRGGIGIVMRARDRRTDRVVALKQLQSLAPEARLRFEREMRITARLQHPGVVPVLETGRFASGEPFYAMKLVQGRSLKEVIAETKTLDERIALLPHVLAVAETIAYAHSQRIIHRDLKPSNVIVGSYGETVVIDWGLAKDLDIQSDTAVAETSPYRATSNEGDLTVAGQVIGTPAYMAPEQALGLDVDEWADVYAIGAILYHLLAGESPYRAASSAEVIAAVSKGPPISLTARDRGVPVDLAAVVGKAMERKPSARYASAKLMADDLRRFQAGQLVGAHQYSMVSLLGRWINRHRAISLLSLVSAIAMVGLAAGDYFRIERERDTAIAERGRAEAALTQSRQRASELIISQAQSLVERDPTRAMDVLRSYDGTDWPAVRSLAAQAMARGVGTRGVDVIHSHIADLRLVDDGHAYIFIDTDNDIYEGGLESGLPARIARGSRATFDLTADGKMVLFAKGKALAIFNRISRSEEIIGWSMDQISQFVIDPLGRWAALAAMDGTIRVWEHGEKHGKLSVLNGHKGPPHWLASSPNGNELVSTGLDGTVRLWNIASSAGRVLGRCHRESRIYFSPDGRYIAWSGAQGDVQLFDLAANRLSTIPGTSELAGPLAFSPDSSTLAGAAADLEVSTWRLPAGIRTYKARATSRVYDIRFAHDGSTLVWADDSAVHVIDEAGMERRYRGTGSDPTADLWDDRMVTGGGKPNLKIWNVSGSGVHLIHRHKAMVSRLAVSRDGQWLATTGNDQKVRVSRVDGGASLAFDAASDFMGSPAFNANGDRLLVPSWDGNAYLWNLPSGVRRLLQGHGSGVNAVTFSNQGQPITIDAGGTIVLWNDDGRIVRRYIGYGSGAWPILRLDEGKFIVAEANGDVRMWHFGDGTDVLLGKHDGAISSVAVSSRGVVAVGGKDPSAVSLFAVPPNEPPLQPRIGPPRRGKVSLSFSSDGRYLAAGGYDQKLLVYDFGTETLSSFMLDDGVVNVAFARSGYVLIASTGDGMLLAWDLSHGTQRLVVVDPSGAAIQDLKLSPDGRRAFFGLCDGTVGSWDIDLKHPVPVDTQAFKSWLASVTQISKSTGLTPETGR
jgi:WD40 repeat protein